MLKLFPLPQPIKKQNKKIKKKPYPPKYNMCVYYLFSRSLFGKPFAFSGEEFRRIIIVGHVSNAGSRLGNTVQRVEGFFPVVYDNGELHVVVYKRLGGVFEFFGRTIWRVCTGQVGEAPFHHGDERANRCQRFHLDWLWWCRILLIR